MKPLPAPVPQAPADEPPFWRRKTMLEEMTPTEWESLCDGCGRCCLIKLQDEDTGANLPTASAASCSTAELPLQRLREPHGEGAGLHQADPAQHRPPHGCRRPAATLVADGKALHWWHPLVSGDPDTVHQAEVSVRGKVGASEVDVPDDELENHIVSWPLKWPKGAKGR